MTDDPCGDPALDEVLEESAEELELMDRLLADYFGGRRHLEDPFLVIAHAQEQIPAPAMSHRPAEPASDDPLVERTRAAVHSLLGRLERGVDDARARVAALLAQPRAARWREAHENPALHEVPVVAELLRRAEEEELPSAEVELLVLLALQVVPHVRFGEYPARWVGDFSTRAWVLLAELALAERGLARADFAVECARANLAIGSGDSLLVFEVGLRRGFLEWAEGRGASATAAFKVVGRLARALHDPRREGEVFLWLFLLYDQLEDHERVSAARAKALSLLGADTFQQTLRSHARTMERLGLVLVPREPGHGKEPVS